MTFPDDLQHVIRTDEPLTPHLWLGIGGPARFFAEPVDSEQVQRIFQVASKQGLAIRILGSGSNVLVREAGFDGVVISLAAPGISELRIDGNELTAGAGARLSHTVIKAVGAGLGGLEHLVGIPGSTGGAVFGNVFGGGRDIGSTVKSVTVLDSDCQLRTLSQDDVGFSYRKTALPGMVILETVFALEQRDPVTLTKRMQKLWIARNAQRPEQETRIASPFVDPDGIVARDLIQSVGLAGIREGDVSLDLRQPNYLVAHSGATSDQCLRLIERVREQVLLQKGIDLQLNLQIW